MKIFCSAHSEKFPAKKYSKRVNVKFYGELHHIDLNVGDSVTLDCSVGVDAIDNNNDNYRYVIFDNMIVFDLSFVADGGSTAKNYLVNIPELWSWKTLLQFMMQQLLVVKLTLKL